MSANFPERPLISVVMPVYNRERYVAEALSSILAQSYTHLEFIVVVDDGSTDGSADIVRDFAARDARIHPIFMEHGSQGRARNVGIAAARGELIAHMDDDDIALPPRLAAQITWMRQTGVDICGSYVKTFGTDDGILWFPETHEAIQCELLFRIGLLQPTVLMRADIAKAHPYDEQATYEDYEMWTRIAHLYRMGNTPQILLKERCHPQQIHIVKKISIREDQRTYRHRYFHTLFPETTAGDYAALDRVVEKEPFPNLVELERAGGWLARLAQTPDNLLRQRMAGRWQAACQRSAHLGLGCYRLYRQIAPQFGISPKPGAPKLWLACALRLKPGSRLEWLLKEIRQVSRRPIDFA